MAAGHAPRAGRGRLSTAAVAYLAATAAYAGFQWTIRLVVYPQFARVADGFEAYHAAHSRLVSIAVGPLFAAVGVTSLVVAADVGGLAFAAPALCALLLGLTAVGAVPQHGRLAGGFDAATHRRLVRVDTARLVVALASVALAVVLAVR